MFPPKPFVVKSVAVLRMPQNVVKQVFLPNFELFSFYKVRLSRYFPIFREFSQ
jgi:hypothetical protein